MCLSWSVISHLWLFHIGFLVLSSPFNLWIKHVHPYMYNFSSQPWFQLSEIGWIISDLGDCLSVLGRTCDSVYLNGNVPVRNTNIEHFNRKKKGINFSTPQLTPTKWHWWMSSDQEFKTSVLNHPHLLTSNWCETVKASYSENFHTSEGNKCSLKSSGGFML